MHKHNTVALSSFLNIEMGQSPEAEFVNQDCRGVPLLNGPAEFTDRYPTPVQYTTNPKRFAQKGDILFCVRGSTTGRMNIADQKYAIGRGLAAISHKEGKELNAFAKGIIDNKLKSLLGGTLGSVFPNLTKDQLYNFKCSIPNILAQRQIAAVLSALDGKIELNKRINSELEQMAKTLYDYWFVQFDFPNEEGKPYKSAGGKMVYNEVLKREVPEGWGHEQIGDLGTVVGGSTPSKLIEENFSQLGIPWITPKDLSMNVGNKFITRGELDVSEKGLKKASLNILDRGSVLMSSRAPVGYLAINRIPCSTNQGFKSIICNKKYSCEYVYYVVRQYMPTIEANATGSTFKEISGSIFKSISIIKPKKLIVEEFIKKMKSVFQKQENVEEQNQQLSNLRDWLLPMLMNGQVKVEQTDRYVEPQKEHDRELAMVAEDAIAYKMKGGRK